MRMPTHDPRCLCWYWNWFNESAVDYYLNELVLPQVSKEGFDGIFFDGSDGFLRGTWKQAVNVPHNASDQDALEATVGVHKRGAELLLAHDKYPIYSEHLDDTTPEQQAWVAAAMIDTPYFRFYEGFRATRPYIDSLLNETQRAAQGALPVVVHASTAAAPNIESITNDLAAFLVVAENYSYFMASAGWLDAGWSWHPEYNVEYGTPIAPATVAVDAAGGAVYTRPYTRCTVTVNCTSIAGDDRGATLAGNAPESSVDGVGVVDSQPPFNCSVFGCTCQGFANHFGTHAGHGFGCASEAAKQWWVARSCNANANCACCKGPACSLPGAAPCICPSDNGKCLGTITMHGSPTVQL